MNKTGVTVTSPLLKTPQGHTTFEKHEQNSAYQLLSTSGLTLLLRLIRRRDLDDRFLSSRNRRSRDHVGLCSET
jgi:hypothetical protein